MRSPKFLQANGGWDRIVWMPESAKERVKDFIPENLVDKIATEKDLSTVEELAAFLREKGHPVVERWKAAPIEAVAGEKLEVSVERPARAEAVISAPLISATPIGGGFKIILKNAKIRAEKVIITRSKE